MEIVKVGNYTWQKYAGDEGQDVYVALFAHDKDSMLGKYPDESDYDIVIDNDADFYLPADCDMVTATNCNRECLQCVDESRLAFKFRKNVFTQEEQDGAYKGLYGSAVESNNRGLAAGPRTDMQGKRDWVTGYQQDVLDYYEKGQPNNVDGTDPLVLIKQKHEQIEHEIRGGVWLRTKVEPEFGSYTGFFPKLVDKLNSMSIQEAVKEVRRVKRDMISSTSYATAIWSGIAGFYGRYPRIPYGRPTAYVDHNRELFEYCYPFARKLDKTFAKLVPGRYAFQKKCADQMDKRFLIARDTTFTTITVNTTEKGKNARMACHRDAGSLNEGFSNLTVISDGKRSWKGGYLVTPEVRAAINVRPGDLLLIDNMRVIHANTPIEPEDGDTEDNMQRMSLVFYFREDMLQLGSWEYESIRRQYVDHRRLNEQHKLWKPYWNGVSAGMWDEQEWYDYLSHDTYGGLEMLAKYHPKALETTSTLDGFFS